MSASLSIVPLSWDIEYIILESGVTNHFGYKEEEDGIHFKYSYDDYDNVTNVIENYPVTYMSVLRPKIIDKIIQKRKDVILGFTIGGLPIPLDEVTQTNLVGCTVGFERNPNIQGIDWHMGGGVFIYLTRYQLMGIADASFSHIQQAFSRQRELVQAVYNSTTTYEIEGLDILSGWPSDPYA